MDWIFELIQEHQQWTAVSVAVAAVMLVAMLMRPKKVQSIQAGLPSETTENTSPNLNATPSLPFVPPKFMAAPRVATVPLQVLAEHDDTEVVHSSDETEEKAAHESCLPCESARMQRRAEDETTTVHNLPGELVLQIFSFCSAHGLLAAAATCKAWNECEEDASGLLWSRLVASDYPLARPAAQQPPCASKALHGKLSRGAPIEVQMVHKKLQPGSYGSALWVDVQYEVASTISKDGPSQLVSVAHGPASIRPQLFIVGASRSPLGGDGNVAAGAAPGAGTGERMQLCAERATSLRPACGSKVFAPRARSFEGELRVGMVVELQWKGRNGPRYNYWFALVHRVHARGDAVDLCFPQYGADQSAVLMHVCTIQRRAETAMHGGLAGGVRIPGRAEVDHWWTHLLSEDLDRPDCGGAPVTALASIRDKFNKFLPEGQPAESLRLAPEQGEE